ncbi:putative glutathione-specific gamma-glutamylcyclotransferase 2 [Episyrphus balteatus]|uniref:putative glutathione-specific gamma-glutamylcyclotransferase 2 n=1 Tax=Episyrphus balteatus TaxID=286459 RepID=UPI00248570AF|nr:putative glutathione-specific gamma-glutamylcyclotransferase 2 [Episyrphus balteatus]
MSQKENKQFNLNKCDNLNKLRDILLQINCATKSIQVPLESHAQELFAEYFQSLFTFYDEKFINKNKGLPTTEASAIPPTDEDLWIFGYGSLVWKADFPYIDKKQGYIEGYQRRFFQHSIDHRGTPEKPGRVVTLIPSNDSQSRVYGVAYRIARDQKKDVLAHLDYREKNGYERNTLRFIEFNSSVTFDIIMYIATNENDSFAGGNDDDLQPIADQIYTTAGPSGPNREYLYFLANAMRELFQGVVDEHLFKLEELVKRRERKDEMLADVIKSKILKILEIQDIDDAVEEFKELLANCNQKTYLDELVTDIQCDR